MDVEAVGRERKLWVCFRARTRGSWSCRPPCPLPPPACPALGAAGAASAGMPLRGGKEETQSKKPSFCGPDPCVSLSVKGSLPMLGAAAAQCEHLASRDCPDRVGL